MGKRAKVEIKESLSELKSEFVKFKDYKSKQRIKSLILTKEDRYKTREALAKHLDISTKCLYSWTKNYKEGGLTAMLKSCSGGAHNKVISQDIKDGLEKKLQDSFSPLKGYTFAVAWVREEFGVEINYQTLRSFMISNFGTKLKRHSTGDS